MSAPRRSTGELRICEAMPFRCSLLRIALWSILSGVVSGILVLGIHYSERRDLAQARLSLLEGDFQRATRLFRPLTTSFWNREEAEIGLGLSTRLGRKVMDTDPLTGAGLDRARFPYRLLLLQAMRERRFEGCLRVAKFLGNGVEGIALFEAAASLELGIAQLQAPIAVKSSAKLVDKWLANRLSACQRLSNATGVLYDRWGRLIAARLSDGQLEKRDGLSSCWLTDSYLDEALLHWAGGGVRLSIDLELSRLAAAALEGYRGSIVILSPRTGEVMTAVSDLASRSKGNFPAFEQLREPASISKILTSVAAFRQHLEPDEEISVMACEGAERYKGGILYCLCRSGPLSGLNQAMAVSCNIAFANLGLRVGRQGMLDELHRHGFNWPPKSGMVFGSVLTPEGNELQLAHLSIGLEATNVTPVHAALLVAAFANGGVMPEPRLIAGEDGWLGLSPRFLQSETGTQVIDPAWIPTLLASMVAVTKRGGTAYGISPPGFPLAVKTGTGRNKNLGFHTNYIGIGPMPNPKIAFCVRVTDQSTSRRVRRATRKVARRLFDGLAAKPYLIR